MSMEVIPRRRPGDGPLWRVESTNPTFTLSLDLPGCANSVPNPRVLLNNSASPGGGTDLLRKAPRVVFGP